MNEEKSNPYMLCGDPRGFLYIKDCIHIQQAGTSVVPATIPFRVSGKVTVKKVCSLLSPRYFAFDRSTRRYKKGYEGSKAHTLLLCINYKAGWCFAFACPPLEQNGTLYQGLLKARSPGDLHVRPHFLTKYGSYRCGLVTLCKCLR
jgi:hypothetical protein